MSYKYSLSFIILMGLFLPFQAQATPATRISAAASMTDALRQMVTEFHKLKPQAKIITNFAASGALAKQIAQGAPADLYISANPKWLNYLRDQGKVVPTSIATLIANSLVFIGPPDSSLHTMADLSQVKRLALASPQSAPAGQYAAQAMIAVGIYTKLQQDNKLIIAKDVRQALIYAERGEVDGAFVYGSDARLAQHSIILFPVPANQHEAIIYPIALTKTGQNNPTAQAFYRFALGNQGQAILCQFGFTTP